MTANDISSVPTNENARLIVVVPAHNEERSIGSLVIKLKANADEVIVVDDGSNDLTEMIARTAGAIIVRHKTNLGKGEALNSGLRKARELEADFVVTIDADGQHLPEEIDALLAPLQADEADIVVGSRYLEPGSKIPRHRIWGHKFFTFLTNQASGIPVTDSQSGYRAFSKEAVKALTFS